MKFPLLMTFIALVRFMSRFFEAIVNGSVSMNSFSTCSLLLYREVNWFVFPDSLSCHFTESIGHFFMGTLPYNIISSAIRGRFISSFLFVSLKCPSLAYMLRAPVSTQSSVSRSSGVARQHCLIPDISGVVPWSFHLGDVGCGFILHSFYSVEVCSPNPSLSRTFTKKVCWTLSKALSTSTEMIM